MGRLTRIIGNMWIELVYFYVNVNFHTNILECRFPLCREAEQRPAVHALRVFNIGAGICDYSKNGQTCLNNRHERRLRQLF